MADQEITTGAPPTETAALPTAYVPSTKVLQPYLSDRFNNTEEVLAMVRGDADAAVIVRDAKTILPDLHRRAQPGGDQAVLTAMRLIALDRPPKGKTKEHWEAHTKLYYAKLSEYPAAAIEAAASDILEDDQILGFPNVAQFVAKVKPHAQRIRMEAYRVRRIAEMADALPKPPPTPEERAAVAKMMAEVGMALRPPLPRHATDEERRARMVADLRKFEVKPKGEPEV